MFRHIKNSERGDGLVKGVIGFAILIIIFAIGALLSLPNRITRDRALTQIAEIANVQPEQIQVLSQTDYNPITGDTYDVRFVLRINQKDVSAECTVSSWFSDMVCKLYNNGN